MRRPSQILFAVAIAAISGTLSQAQSSVPMPCSLAGVPSLLSIAPNGGRFPFYFAHPCPNCPNDLFEPRPNGRIDLLPGQTAHFLLGATAFDTDNDPWMQCPVTPAVEFKASPDSAPAVLPLEARICAALDISAWRQGAFDRDPNYLRWAKAHQLNMEAAQLVPQDCNKPALLAMGRPQLISAGPNLAFGFSAERPEFVHGEKVMLHLWVDNTGDAPANVITCQDLDYFKARGFDLYDGYGHRVLSREEVRIQDKCKTNPRAAAMEAGGWTCFRNFAIPVPAHTCVSGNGYDFTLDLSDRYDLPAGEYTLHMRDNWRRAAQRACEAHQEPPYRTKPGDVRFAVVQP